MTEGIDENHDYESVGRALDLQLLRRLGPFAREQRNSLLLGLALLLALTALDLLGPWIIRLAVDGPVHAATDAIGTDGGIGPAERRRLIHQVLLFGLAYAGCVIASFLGRYWEFITLQTAGQRILQRIRDATFSHLHRLPISFYDRNQSGRLVSRVTSDVETLNELFTSGLVNLAGDILKVVVLLVVVFFIDPRLAAIAAVSVPILAVTSAWFRIRARQAYRETRSAIAQVNGYLGETLSGIRVIQGFSAEQRAERNFGSRNRRYRETNMRTVFYFALFFPVVDWITYTVQGGVFWLGGIEIANVRLTVGEFIQFWYYLNLMFEPLRELAEKYNVLQSAMASSERIFALLDTPAEPEPATSVSLPESIAGAIRFTDVWFAYRTDEPVVKGLSFEVLPGQTLAIVGPTGGGKSTLTSLLLRMYEPTHGTIEVDGIDIRTLPRAFLRRHIGYVPQDVLIFKGTVLDNILMGRDGLNADDAMAAARAIGADEWIERLPGSYRHALSERGANLSTGERQMLAFTRALVGQPSVLILDEATSSVDSETEHRIQRAIDVLLRGRTALVVAHRLSTVRRANTIAVMHHGQIREIGSHANLMAQDGLYRRYQQLQLT